MTVALLCVLVVALGFVAFCLADLVRAQVRYLPKAAWALIVLGTVPWGGLVYLVWGKVRKPPRPAAFDRAGPA